jgi:hypothetical protein
VHAADPASISFSAGTSTPPQSRVATKAGRQWDSLGPQPHRAAIALGPAAISVDLPPRATIALDLAPPVPDALDLAPPAMSREIERGRR